MLYNEIVPVRKFIMTDLLGQNNGYKYTSGYIYSISSNTSGAKPYMCALSVITRVGKTGKPRLQQKELYVAPLVVKDLIGTSYVYDGVGHILTKLEKKDVLKMSSFEFLSWAYAHILHLDRLKVKQVWPSIYDNTMDLIRKFAREFDNTDPAIIDTVTNNLDVRKHFLTKISRAYIFTKEQLAFEQRHNNLARIIEGHIQRLEDDQYKPMRNKLKNYYNTVIDKGKLSEELFTENKNVLHEYESSGYWD